MVNVFPIDATYGAGIECIASNNAVTAVGQINGDYVHDLISQLATDVDDDYLGMAIIGHLSNEGVWQYSRGDWYYNTSLSGRQ